MEEIAPAVEKVVEKPATENLQPITPVIPVYAERSRSAVEGNNKQPSINNQQPTTKVSALSLASIRAKKEMTESFKAHVQESVHLPSETFTETEMLEQWVKYAQRMEDKGYRIIASLLTINDPTLDGTTIVHELPNESSKIDFDKEKPELLGYLRGKLHNHDININIKVNETLVSKRAYTNQDKYNRLLEINTNLELLRKMFGLEF
ncbi:DNA polymerase III subunit gamma/tau [Flavobacterium sp.]|uniref:DNA polymerase III subunit gamma/tau n=1 Tax=Flavobacterium sp. TaxID=239 RepID=UPI0025E4A294|nr:DNA polymerase III subunit gamma/tau [Flavobacterium sp.]